MKYAFYPGCAVDSSSKEYRASSEAISEALGIELIEIPGWNCCGAIDAIHSYKPLYSLAIDARNLCLAESMDMDVVTLCSACYNTLLRTKRILQEEPAIKNKVDKALKPVGLNYSGNVKIRHFLEVLLSDGNLEKIAAKVKIPLTSLTVASYYGCFLVRPPLLTNFDDSEHPTSLDELVEALGASTVEYYGKIRCCGASLGVTNEKIMLEMSRNILLNAKNAGANCMITACPLCHFNLDAKQKDVESEFDLKIELPILHFTQLVGLAFGIAPTDLGLNRNCVSPKKILPHYARSVA